jgi:hypothetical protein
MFGMWFAYAIFCAMGLVALVQFTKEEEEE